MGNFFIRRPIVAMVISIVLVLLGVVAMQTLPVSTYPDITPPEIQVTTYYRGANAVNVEQAVALPIEEKVNGVEKMLYMKSTNSNDGGMTLRVTFEPGTDLDNANMLTQNRVSQGQSFLPVEVKNEGVVTKKSLAFPLMLISIKADSSKLYDPVFLSNYADINFVDPISRISGVGQVTLFGGSKYAMRVWLRPDRLSGLNVTVPEVLTAIREQNTIASGGIIGAPPFSNKVDVSYNVVLQDRLKTPEQFGNIIIRADKAGREIKLKDVARVAYDWESFNNFGRLNGENAAVIGIYQVPGSNALEVANQVKATAKLIAERFPPGIEYEVTLDTTLSITAGIEEIIHTLFEAVLLVILVVLLFLQNWRATIIPLLTVPVSLIATFILFPVLGFSINNLSLLGLVLAIGIVVDDAIVVVEAVMHNMDHGLSPKEATEKAMKEIAGPVMAIALILAAVFVPVAFVPGISGSLYQQFAVTIAISVLFSAFSALTLSPALAVLLLKPKKEIKPNLITRFFDGFNFYFNKITEGYVGITGFFVRKSLRGMLVIVVAIIGTVLLTKNIPGGFVPNEDEGYFMVNIELPEGSSLQRTDAVVKKVERIIAKLEGVKYATAIPGYSLMTQNNGFNKAAIFLSLEEWEDRETVKEILHRLNMAMLIKVPEATCFAFEPPPIPGLGTSAGFTFMLLDKSGKEPKYLADQSQAFLKAANARPEIGRISTFFNVRVPQMRLEVDFEKAKKLGVRIDDLNKTINAFLGGMYVNDVNRFGKQYKVMLQAESTFREKESDMAFFFVRTESGDMIPISVLAKVSREYGPDFTNRFNMSRAAEISGVPAEGYSSAQAMKALEEVAAVSLPLDMSYSWANLSYQEKQAEGKAGIVFIFAIVMVFLILAAQYESWGLPFSVLLATPIAIVGAFLGLWLVHLFKTNYINNIFAQISLIMLIGLSAKNAILIVEFARALTEQGRSIKEAAIEAARLRFRPILMTALAFILGVLPLLTAYGAGAEARKVMGVVVFSGMVMASVVGIMIVPASFAFVEGLLKRNKK